MSVAAYLSSLLSIEGNEMPLDPSFVEKFIRSVEDLQSFNEFVKSQPVLGRTICSAASWELFDTIYVLSLSDSHGDSFRVLCDAALLLTSEVRPKEMLLMISEKLAGCNETTTLQLLLLTMQQMLLKTADEMIWKQGFSSVFRKVVIMSGHQHDEKDEEEVEQEQARGLPPENQNTVELVIDFTTQLVDRFRAAFAEGNGKINTVLVGFTLSLNAKVLLHIKDPQLRHQYVTSTTNLLYRLTGGDLHSIFRHIYRAKFAIFRHELDSAKRAYLQQYCHRHVETCKERGMAVALCTEDANSLMNRIAQSEFSTTLLRYYDTTAASAGVSPSLPHSTVANATTPTLGWEEAVCWDHVTDERLVEILTSTTAAFRGEEPIQEDFDCGAPELVWSLSGIALLAHCVLNSLLSAELSTDPLLPLVYNPAYLADLLRPYALVLLRSPAANPEGLQMMNFLYGSSALARVLRPAGHLHHQEPAVPIFMSFLAQQTVPSALSHITLSFYDSLSAFRSLNGSNADKLYWSAEDAAKLGHLAARANDILATAQTFITTMAGCADDELRSKCFSSFRQYLKQLEERSLFGLLLMLVEHCPFPNMAGLLIDLIKECVQAASNGHSWSTLPSTTLLPQQQQVGTGGAPDSAAPSTPVVPSVPAVKWLQEFEAHPNISSSRDTTAGDNMKSATTATRRPFPLKKLLRPKSATTTSVSGAATAASADDDITPFDVDSMAVVESKRHTSDPATGGTSVHIDRDSFLDSRAGTTNIGADKLVELREAAPFIWAGRSPFWSPLVLQRCVLEPIRDLLDHVSPEKILECMDIVAARINLAQYCVLKLLSDPSLCTVSGADSADSAAGPAAAASTVSITTAPHPSLLQQQVLDDYFSGSAVNANMNACVTPGGGGGSPFPYLFSKLRAVKDIYALYFDLKKLRKVVKTANKGTVASCSMNPLDSVRMQLLEVNLEHLLNNFRTLCNALYTHLQLVA